MVSSIVVKGGTLLTIGVFLLGISRVSGAGEPWDQAEAKKMVSRVLEVEKEEKAPWNLIPWRVHLSNAATESMQTKKPLFVFFFVEQGGSSQEPCGLEGRLLRAHSLSDPGVRALIKDRFVPVKIKLRPGNPFPVDWPALKMWSTAYRFSNARGFTGCSVVSSDLQVEYGNSGSARLSEMLHSPAFDAKRFAAMLERASSRVTEERALRVQRRIREFERVEEIKRFRSGISRAVRRESRTQLPPKGYSLEQALELYQMAGISPRK